jgi:hypothetical protein
MSINQTVLNLTKHNQIFAKGQKTEICNFSVNIIIYLIYSKIYCSNFAQSGSEFTQNDDENDKLFV